MGNIGAVRIENAAGVPLNLDTSGNLNVSVGSISGAAVTVSGNSVFVESGCGPIKLWGADSEGGGNFVVTLTGANTDLTTPANQLGLDTVAMIRAYDPIGVSWPRSRSTQSGASSLHSFKQETIQHGGNFAVGSGLIVPSTSGGVALTTSLLSSAVTIRFQGSGRIFIGASGYPPVGSGSTDQQRVGFPMYGTYSGNVDPGTRIQISNPAFLSVCAENSGQIVFYGVEAVF